MSEADYYPPGAYNDPDAPYNQPVIPERDFDVTVSQTLSRNVKVTTDNYRPEYDDEDGCTYANTEDTDWKEVYGQQHLTILELLEDYKLRLEILKTTLADEKEIKRINYLLSECEDWVEDDFEVNE